MSNDKVLDLSAYSSDVSAAIARIKEYFTNYKNSLSPLTTSGDLTFTLTLKGKFDEVEPDCRLQLSHYSYSTFKGGYLTVDGVQWSELADEFRHQLSRDLRLRRLSFSRAEE